MDTHETEHDDIDVTDAAPDDGAVTATPAPAVPPTPAARPAPLMVQLPQAAFAKLKAAERERGKRAALDALDAEARGLGWGSYAEMREAAASLKRRPPAQAPAPEPAYDYAAVEGADLGDEDLTPPQQTRTREARQVQRLLDDRRRLNRSITHAERKRRAAEEGLAAQQAETALRVAAARHGVRDVDYALTLLRREMEDMDEEALAGFDEDAYFRERLRDNHPFLYVAEAPATTGTSGGAPRPSTHHTAAEGGAPPLPPGAVDAKKLSRDDYDRLLRERGLLNPAVGSSSTF